MVISLGGALPLGVLNITASGIAANEGVKPALIFSFGVLLVEVLYVRITLTGLTWLMKNSRIYHRVYLVTTCLLLLMGAAMLIQSPVSSGTSLFTKIHPPVFVWGILLSAVNPAQIPFWIGWNTVLLDKGILKTGSRLLNIYVCGIGAGTLGGLSLFIAGGHLAAAFIRQHQYILHAIIALTFLLMAFYRFYRLWKGKAGLTPYVVSSPVPVAPRQQF